MAVLDAETLAPATTPPPARLSKISQEDFDAMVQESIDTFDMEPEEAVESALEECAMQKRDVSAICKKADGVNAREALPIVVAFRKLDAQLPKGVPLPGTTEQTTHELDAAKIAEAIDDVRSAITACSDDDERANMLCIAADVGLTGCALYACRCAAATADSALLVNALHALKDCLGAQMPRDVFVHCKGSIELCAYLTTYADDVQVATATCVVVEAAASKHEASKDAHVKAGIPTALVGIFEKHADDDAACLACVEAMRRIATADDPTPMQASGAFRYARDMGKGGGAVAVLSAIKRRASRLGSADLDAALAASKATDASASAEEADAREDDADASTPSVPTTSAADASSLVSLLASLVATLKRLAANDEVVMLLFDAGVVPTTLSLIAWCTGPHSFQFQPRLCRSACSLLWQTACSDGPKESIINDGTTLLGDVVRRYPKHAGVLEQAVGALGAATLRQPALAESAASMGAFETCADALKAAPEKEWVCRQACLAGSNMVRRSDECKSRAHAANLEELVRSARARHPKSCKDVGTAFLRDLGIEDYKN